MLGVMLLFFALIQGVALAGTTSYVAVEDTFVSGGSPTAINGSQTFLKVDDGMPKIGYVKFNVTVPAGEQITTAKIRLFGSSGQSAVPIDFHTISNTWSESTTNFNNRPTLGAKVGSGTLVVNGWMEATVTVPVSGGTISLAIVRPGLGTDSEFQSSEGTNKPTLVVTTQTVADTTAPSVPTNLQGTGDLTPKVALTWTASTDNVGVTGYTINKNGIALPNVTATSYNDTDVVKGQIYSYTVEAFDAAGNRSAATTPVSVTVPNDPPPPPPPPSEGILLSPSEIAALPTTGPEWQAVLNRANNPLGGSVQVSTRSSNGVDLLAKAFVAARLNDNTLKGVVRDGLRATTLAGRDNNDVLATLRQLQTYVIAADIIQLSIFDPAFDASFRTWLNTERNHNYAGGGGGGSVISVHNFKPNNFGTHAGASRIAAALYLGDTSDFQAAANVWEGWVTGNDALLPLDYNWHTYDWHADVANPQGINPLGATRNGNRLDGVIPEDQERCGNYSWPPCATNYVHGAMDGTLLSFWMMSRKGYDSWNWSNQATLRQYQWKIEVGQPAYNGFRWQVPVINKVYGTAYGDADPSATSTNFGFAAWWTK
jgi:hypothetical protein